MRVAALFGIERGDRRIRVVYNIVAVLTLAPVVAYHLYLDSLGAVTVVDWSTLLLPLQIVLWLTALALFFWSARYYDLGAFLGLRAYGARAAFVSDGPLMIVRHPWYLALLILVWSRDLALADLVTGAAITAYLVVGSLFEERKLVAEFGEHYRAYQKRTAMLVPWLRWPGRYRSM